MIIETVLSTVNKNNKPYFAAAGVEFLDNRAKFYLYKESNTVLNLRNRDFGIINIVDKAEYLIKAALTTAEIDTVKIQDQQLYYLADCCSYYQFEVSKIKNLKEKYLVEVDILKEQEKRKYIGFNRANNLLLEAAVIASRIGITKTENDLIQFIKQNRRVINKTGDKNTKELLKLLKKNIKNNNNNRSDSLDSN